MEAQPPPQPTPPLLSPPHYPDSLDSSPRSRNTDSWDDPYPPPTPNNLRFMVSYGGHISPRPHDKTLCYVGGETRIVVVDRHNSFPELSASFSKTLLNGRAFSLKYQLPNDDLDSLISITTDEDFENMIEEFDRRSSNSSSSKPSRIRLFLFPSKPYSSGPVSVFDGPGPGLDSGKSEDWLTGSRFVSDSASVNCLLGVDEEVAASGIGSINFASCPEDAAAAATSQPGNGKNLNLKLGYDVQSVPNSLMLDANSSFGSTSSSPSVANLPRIKVHVEDGGSSGGGGRGGGVRGEDQKVDGVEEQFAKLGVGGVGRNQDGEIVRLSSPVDVSPVLVSSAAAAASEYQKRVVSDDERSDHGMPVGYRKLSNSELQMQMQTQPQAQVLPPRFQQKSTGGVLPSPNSVSSDSSFTNAMSRPKPVNVINQDQVQIQSGASRVPTTSIDLNHSVSDPHGQVQMQQHVPDPRYVLQHQYDQNHQQQQQALQHQFDQQQQQQQALQHQFDQQQQQALQHQFDQQQQQQQQALQHQFDQQQQQALQHQFDQQQQQQQQALQHQFDQQQQQQALQHQFDQQQQQRQQQQLALQHQFDQQQQQQALQNQFDQQQQQQALQHQFDQQQQQQALEHQFDQQQQHHQQQSLQHQFDQQQRASQHQFDKHQQQQETQQPQQAQQTQQFMHGTHFIHQTPAGPVSIPAYYPAYPSQQQLHPQHHYQLDQQYQVYYMPSRQAQAYNLSMQQQANPGESATTIPSSQAQNLPNPAAMVPPSAACTPMRNAPNSEMTTDSTYKTAAASTPQLVQVSTGQHQQQYVAYSQIHHPSQSMVPNSAAPANYVYNYANPAHAQNLASTMPSQSRS